VDTTELTSRIRGLVLPHLPPTVEGAPETWVDVTASNVDFASDGAWSVDWPEAAPLTWGRQLITVQIQSTHARRRVSVTLTVHAYAQTPQVVAPISRGQEVSAHQVGWVWTDLAQMKHGVVADPRDLVGMMLSRDVMPGQTLTRGDLAPRPMVRRGELVDLVVKRGEVAAVIRAECRQDGRMGQMVSVMNPLTKRPVLACVSAPGVVTLGR